MVWHPCLLITKTPVKFNSFFYYYTPTSGLVWVLLFFSYFSHWFLHFNGLTNILTGVFLKMWWEGVRFPLQQGQLRLSFDLVRAVLWQWNTLYVQQVQRSFLLVYKINLANRKGKTVFCFAFPGDGSSSSSSLILSSEYESKNTLNNFAFL